MTKGTRGQVDEAGERSGKWRSHWYSCLDVRTIRTDSRAAMGVSDQVHPHNRIVLLINAPGGTPHSVPSLRARTTHVFNRPLISGVRDCRLLKTKKLKGRHHQCEAVGAFRWIRRRWRLNMWCRVCGEKNIESIRVLERKIGEGGGDTTELKRIRNSLLNVSIFLPPEILGCIFAWTITRLQEYSFTHLSLHSCHYHVYSPMWVGRQFERSFPSLSRRHQYDVCQAGGIDVRVFWLWLM